MRMMKNAMQMIVEVIVVIIMNRVPPICKIINALKTFQMQDINSNCIFFIYQVF